MNALIYAMVLLCWGGSWIAIKWQEGPVPTTQAILYRFLLAFVILAVYLLYRKRWSRMTLNDHGFCVLQGLCLFSLNFQAFYHATAYIPSGLVAVVMSSATFFNAWHSRLFWGVEITRRFYLGASMGLLGLGLLFIPELSRTNGSMSTLIGIGLTLLGTWSFSLGNMVGMRHHKRQRDLRQMTTVAMFYGCVVSLAISLFQSETWVFDISSRFIGAWLFLAIFASVLGFTLYLSLVNRLGAARAAYALVITPIVALTLSSLFEGYRWTPLAGLGLSLAILGNVLVLLPPFSRWPGFALRLKSS